MSKIHRVSFLFPLGLAGPTICHACATLSDEDEPVRVTDESALIIWDAKSGTEQFVRRASFETQAKNFGFLVPTPSRPQLSEVEDTLFDQLENELEPKIEHRVQEQQHWSLWGWYSHQINSTFRKDAPSMAAIKEEPLEVVEQKKIGGYDTTVLKASEAGKIKTWLQLHHYPVTADFENWMTPYARRGWYLTAFKVPHEVSSEAAQLKSVNLKFHTQAPFYPYSESKEAQKKQGERTLRVFYLGANRPAARIENGSRQQAWSASTDYSAPLNTSTLAAKNLTLPSGSLRLTAFLDESSPRPGWGDLQFSPSSDQSERTPPARIIVENRGVYYPVDIAIVALLSGGLWWKARQKRVRRSSTLVQSI